MEFSTTTRTDLNNRMKFTFIPYESDYVLDDDVTADDLFNRFISLFNDGNGALFRKEVEENHKGI